MKPMNIACWIGVAILFMIFIFPWILLGIFALLAWMGIIELEPITEIVEILRSVVTL